MRRNEGSHSVTLPPYTPGDRNVNEELSLFDVRELVGYVESTQNDDGGYCFYRLNESNAADTFYAVYVLTALNRPVPEPELTADFLQQRQSSDGSFQSIYSADYVLRGLDLLQVAPLCDPDDFLLMQLQHTLSIVKQPYYELNEPFLESLGRTITLIAVRHGRLSPLLMRKVAAAVRPYKRHDGGFGTAHATVYSTNNAVRASSLLPSDVLNGVSQWIRRCEWQSGGISQTPANTPNYLDATCQGLSIMRAVNARPRYPQQTVRFIAHLQNADGGFRRAADSGTSSIKNTFYALKAIVELTCWK